MTMLDDFDTQIQCEEYWYADYSYIRVDDYEDIPTDDIIDDEDDFLDDTGENDVIYDDDDEDYFTTPLIDDRGGITAEGYNYLHELDTNGYFV